MPTSVRTGRGEALPNITAVLPPVAGEQILLVYDATTFGSASSGLAITDQRIARSPPSRNTRARPACHLRIRSRLDTVVMRSRRVPPLAALACVVACAGGGGDGDQAWCQNVDCHDFFL